MGRPRATGADASPLIRATSGRLFAATKPQAYFSMREPSYRVTRFSSSSYKVVPMGECAAQESVPTFLDDASGAHSFRRAFASQSLPPISDTRAGRIRSCLQCAPARKHARSHFLPRNVPAPQLTLGKHARRRRVIAAGVGGGSAALPIAASDTLAYVDGSPHFARR